MLDDELRRARGDLDCRPAPGHSGAGAAPPVDEWGVLPDQVGVAATDGWSQEHVVTCIAVDVKVR